MDIGGCRDRLYRRVADSALEPRRSHARFAARGSGAHRSRLGDLASRSAPGRIQWSMARSNTLRLLGRYTRNCQETRALPEDGTRTPREYLSLIRSDQPASGPLRALTLGLERFWYARQTAGAQEFEESLKHLGALGSRQSNAKWIEFNRPQAALGCGRVAVLLLASMGVLAPSARARPRRSLPVTTRRREARWPRISCLRICIIQCAAGKSRPRLREPGAGSLLILADPTDAPSSEDRTALRRYVESGGHILFSGASIGLFFSEAGLFFPIPIRIGNNFTPTFRVRFPARPIKLSCGRLHFGAR